MLYKMPTKKDLRYFLRKDPSPTSIIIVVVVIVVIIIVVVVVIVVVRRRSHSCAYIELLSKNININFINLSIVKIFLLATTTKYQQ